MGLPIGRIRRFAERSLDWLRYRARLARLRDPDSEQRFASLAGEYTAICARFAGNGPARPADVNQYDWETWRAGIHSALRAGVPHNFLAHRLVSHTMVFGRSAPAQWTAERVAIVEAAFRDVPSLVEQLLREDPIGAPNLSDPRYLTSANRAHHASHLAMYAATLGRRFWEADSIVEWGGGYGNMARLIARVNPQVAYTIIDLPELLALQYIYLASILGPDRVRPLPPDSMRPARGVVNLVTSDAVLADPKALRADAFLSTWALTESPRSAQEAVVGHAFFGAERQLLAYSVDDNNAVAAHRAQFGARGIPVPHLRDVSTPHEYWLR